MATARASAASRGTRARWRASRERTIERTWGFSAFPYPTSAFLTRRGSYSKTGTQRCAEAASRAPRAWDSLMAEETLRAGKTGATETAGGPRAPADATAAAHGDST